MALTRKASMTFGTILEAASEHRLCLVECEDRKTGKKVSVICETWQDNGNIMMNPLGKLFSGSPYNEVTPPGMSAPKLI